jgi:hypothetical protein
VPYRLKADVECHLGIARLARLISNISFSVNHRWTEN